MFFKKKKNALQFESDFQQLCLKNKANLANEIKKACGQTLRIITNTIISKISSSLYVGSQWVDTVVWDKGSAISLGTTHSSPSKSSAMFGYVTVDGG